MPNWLWIILFVLTACSGVGVKEPVMDKQAAYLTLYECLKSAHELMAPFVPFLAENVYDITPEETGTFDYSVWIQMGIPGGLQYWVFLAFFVGFAIKVPMFPFHTWLPDAMEGPTPVSALIHAATMVTAGVFLIVRSNVLYELARISDVTLFGFSSPEIVAYTGAITALVAALIAFTQWDIKKVLAYSTVSQLGFMVAAVGMGAYVAGIFHLVAHAFFKALLFLGAGSVIHAMHHEQDMRNMGGLVRGGRMPWTDSCSTAASRSCSPRIRLRERSSITTDWISARSNPVPWCVSRGNFAELWTLFGDRARFLRPSVLLSGHSAISCVSLASHSHSAGTPWKKSSPVTSPQPATGSGHSVSVRR